MKQSSTEQEQKNIDVARRNAGYSRRLPYCRRIDTLEFLTRLCRKRADGIIVDTSLKLHLVKPSELLGNLTLAVDISSVFEQYFSSFNYLIATLSLYMPFNLIGKRRQYSRENSHRQTRPKNKVDKLHSLTERSVAKLFEQCIHLGRPDTERRNKINEGIALQTL